MNHPRSASLAMACLLAPAIPARPAIAAVPGGTTTLPTDEQLIADPAASWEAFLQHGDANAYGAYAVLSSVGYHADGVDAAACAVHASELDAAVRMAPVSIAVRRAAMLCAEATGRDDTAEVEMAVLAALSRHAWSQVSGLNAARPIRVLAASDAYAWLHASGLEFRYDYYGSHRPERYLPMTVAAWDPELGKERRFSFDFVDTGYRLDRDSEFSGYPIQRAAIAEAFIQGQAQGGEAIAADIRAIGEARLASSPEAKRDLLRTASSEGGILSGAAWLVTCEIHVLEGCGEGFVDAWLPYAEQKHVLPMVMLSYAYAHGIGTSPDPDMADALLDAAVELSYQGFASVEYAQLWRTANEGTIPAPLVDRLLAAERDGEPNARSLLVFEQLKRAADVQSDVVPADSIAHLSKPRPDTTGLEYSLLADYYQDRGEADLSLEWRRKGAAAGYPEDQFLLAVELMENDKTDAGRARVRELMVLSAHGGNAGAQRYLAHESSRQGRWSEVEGWLLDAAQNGDPAAIFDLAGVYEWGYPGVVGTVERSVAAYTAIADNDEGEQGAEARRRLAAMAAAGRGMPKDPVKARAWLLADAERGDHESQSLLGSLILQGELGDVDTAEGIRWMERAIAADTPSAYVDYGAWLYYVDKAPGSRMKGVRTWEDAHAKGITLASNNLAWARCTSPDPEVLDARRGLEVAMAMGDPLELGPAEVDTVAACHAAAGEFERARELQSLAIEQVAVQLPADGNADVDDVAASLEGFRQRLALYEGRQGYGEHERF